MEPYTLDVERFRPGKIVEIKHPFKGYCALFMITELALREEGRCVHTLDKKRRDAVDSRRTTFNLTLEQQVNKEIEPDWSVVTSNMHDNVQIGDHWYFLRNWQMTTPYGEAQLELMYDALGGK